MRLLYSVGLICFILSAGFAYDSESSDSQYTDEENASYSEDYTEEDSATSSNEDSRGGFIKWKKSCDSSADDTNEASSGSSSWEESHEDKLAYFKRLTLGA